MKKINSEKGLARVKLTITILAIMIIVAMAFVLAIGEDGISLKLNNLIKTNNTVNAINNNSTNN